MNRFATRSALALLAIVSLSACSIGLVPGDPVDEDLLFWEEALALEALELDVDQDSRSVFTDDDSYDGSRDDEGRRFWAAYREAKNEVSRKKNRLRGTDGADYFDEDSFKSDVTFVRGRDGRDLLSLPYNRADVTLRNWGGSHLTIVLDDTSLQWRTSGLEFLEFLDTIVYITYPVDERVSVVDYALVAQKEYEIFLKELAKQGKNKKRDTTAVVDAEKAALVEKSVMAKRDATHSDAAKDDAVSSGTIPFTVLVIGDKTTAQTFEDKKQVSKKNEWSNFISGGRQDDQMFSHYGDDILYGNAGADTFSVYYGNDRSRTVFVHGGSGQDTLRIPDLEVSDGWYLVDDAGAYLVLGLSKISKKSQEHVKTQPAAPLEPEKDTLLSPDSDGSGEESPTVEPESDDAPPTDFVFNIIVKSVKYFEFGESGEVMTRKELIEALARKAK
jgi:hypothetical protein